ncbi:MAG: hypothetical protein ACLP9L_32410 [Thermoguttaceae bacterium]
MNLTNAPAGSTRLRHVWLIQMFIVLAVPAVMALCAITIDLCRNSHGLRQYVPGRLTAWEKVVMPKLRTADQAGAGAADRGVALVRAFFAERKDRARVFAEEVLSLRGKWVFMKAKLPFADHDAHRRYLRDRFEEMVVSGPELKELIQSVVKGYVSELQGLENDLLVSLRADLSDSDLAGLQAGVVLRTDEAFRREYARSLEHAAGVVARDLPVQVGREALTWVSADIATNITMSLATAVAERLGLSAGVLGTGAASAAETLGVGIAAGFIVDALLDRILRAMGHDPTRDIADKVGEALDTFRDLLLDGDEQAVSTYRKLREMQDEDLFGFVRSECRRAADKVETGGYLGLRKELQRLRDSRGLLRQEALKKLILEGEQS